MDMRTSKFSEEQIIGFLRQAEAAMPIKEIGRKHGFSDASLYKWRSKFAAMDASEASQIWQLQWSFESKNRGISGSSPPD
jgi:putative transposase